VILCICLDHVKLLLHNLVRSNNDFLSLVTFSVWVRSYDLIYSPSSQQLIIMPPSVLTETEREHFLNNGWLK
jgi:hypothetical protein